jgi:hypothetical protein
LIEELNARWQREDGDVELNAVKEQALAEFSRRQRIIASIPLDKWDEKLWRTVSYDGAAHYAAHLNYIMVSR